MFLLIAEDLRLEEVVTIIKKLKVSIYLMDLFDIFQWVSGQLP